MADRSGPRRRTPRAPGAFAGLADVVVARRLALGLTQADLADLAGVGVSSVRTLEAGRATVTLELAVGVLTALGLTLAVGPRAALPEGNGVAIVAPAGEPR